VSGDGRGGVGGGVELEVGLRVVGLLRGGVGVVVGHVGRGFWRGAAVAVDTGCVD